MLGSGAFGQVFKAEATGIVSWEPVTTVVTILLRLATMTSSVRRR